MAESVNSPDGTGKIVTSRSPHYYTAWLNAPWGHGQHGRHPKPGPTPGATACMLRSPANAAAQRPGGQDEFRPI